MIKKKKPKRNIVWNLILTKTVYTKCGWTTHGSYFFWVKRRPDKVREYGQSYSKLNNNEWIGFSRIERLFDTKRAYLYDQSCNDIDSFTKAVEAQIETEHVEKLAKLTSVNIMLQSNNLWKRKCLQKTQQIKDSDDQADKLGKIEPVKG